MNSLSHHHPCPICSHALEYWDREPDRRVFHASCRVCGKFAMTREAALRAEDASFDSRRHRLSGVTRNATLRGTELEIAAADVYRLADSAPITRTPLTALDDLLLLVADRTQSFSEKVPVEWTDYSILYLQGSRELTFLLKQLVAMERIAPLEGDEPIWLVRLTLEGWKRVEELAERRINSHQAFVAMWFDSSMQPAWEIGIAPALEQAGFSAIRVDQIQHNGKIDDRIVAEIRRSALLIADFTGHRGGVYFEAGLALGLGMPVIWTCRQDDISAAHFDTRQYNHITWSDPSELQERLLARIRATVPGARLRSDSEQ